MRFFITMILLSLFLIIIALLTPQVLYPLPVPLLQIQALGLLLVPTVPNDVHSSPLASRFLLFNFYSL